MASTIISVFSLVFLAQISGNFASDFGIFRSVLYSGWVTCDHSKQLNLPVHEIQIFFYDFQNDYNITCHISDAADVITSAYRININRRLVIYVPGYKSHISRSSAELIRNAFKDIPNIYLIIIDHSPYTFATEGSLNSYGRAVTYSYYIGKAVGELLANFRSKGFPSKNIHGVGHSLGSHILGYASSIYLNMTSEKIWRLTGIDPAGPCFSNDFIEEQIRSGLADYVEVYHCNAGVLGTTSVLADTDFFFNDGRIQRQCDTGFIPGFSESKAATCSHKSCMRYWTKTVQNPNYYLAWACDSYQKFSEGKCAGNEMTMAGYFNPGNATGVFYVSTDLYGII